MQVRDFTEAHRNIMARDGHSMKTLLPPGWRRPTGYSNGIVASGQVVFVAGQIGWDRDEHIVSGELPIQVRQALANVVAVLSEAGAGPEHVTRMTWYMTNKLEYLRERASIGEAYREIMGAHYPTMSLVIVSDLLEDGAKVEIEATAVVPA
jgi:enamine deaminase RidA (YjgF/YER057c/UK114 family)